ncbi:MAG TPA: beta-galactosidase, partial [Patescibacteria group bacterium]|nr:beta-galactosidase [Patescibacteria group bacterium]
MAFAEGGILQMRNGYFWDPSTAEYFIPRGIAYQTWNPPVGADQTFEQLEYDFIEFKKIYANSVRAEFVWNEVERTQGLFDWSKPDYMVAKAEQLGLKLFILVGFQYAPNWFPEEWKAVNSDGQRSVVLSYENPSARAACSNYIYQATKRYRNSAAIGGWILGNEYAYFDLWDVAHQFLGFDSYSQASFRGYLSNLYSNNIASLNANWGTSYASFNAVVMPPAYPANRHNPAFFDLIQWRKKSIGDYVAAGAIAAKLADPNHLRTYSMVGGVFSGDDALNTCEDAKTIVARCAAAGAPLDFWSINNYAWASLGSELRTADYGIAKYQQQSGLPVMVSETGHSSTETLFVGASERQAKALPTQMWEALLSGAIGTHVFHWSDRDLFGGYFLRERGFGFVHQNRLIKEPVYWNIVNMFRQMENIKIEHLLGGSVNPRPDVQYYWSINGDMVWPRANQENCMLWGALRRLGYQPGILDDAQFLRGDYTNAPALILSRCMNMSGADLERIATNVIPAGVHVYANADLPGQFDAYGRTNTNWISRMNYLFGLNASNAVPGYDTGITGIEYNGTIYLTGVNNLPPLSTGYSEHYGVWKIWHGLQSASGTTIVTHTGNNGSQAPLPALQIKTIGSARTAINTFSLTDTELQIVSDHFWDIRYNWLRAIFRSHFGVQPVVDLSGAGASYVLPDYRICRDGSILISLLNEHTNSASITLASPSLLTGKTVENLTTGGIVETNSDGVLSLTLSGDEYVLLYAYAAVGLVDQSLVNSNQNKIWFQSAPTAIWPSLTTNQVIIGFDTREAGLTLAITLERLLAPNKTYATSQAVPISGKGSQSLSLAVPDADPNDIYYLSSPEGARYILHASLQKGGVRVSETTLPVRLLWAAHPLSLPTSVVAGSTYSVPVEWQELPSYLPQEYPTPLNRADLWEPYEGKFQFYDIIVQLRNNGGVVASDHYLTSTGT